MFFGLLLALIVAGLAFAAHTQRIRSLERKLAASLAPLSSVPTSGDVDVAPGTDVSSVLERAKSRVLVDLMNDLRTPLMMIKSPLQRTLQISGSPGLDDSDVERMMQQANRLQRGLGQIQHALEIDLGATIPTLRTGDLVAFAERFVTSLGPLAERHGVTVKFSPETDRLPVSFDDEKIEQVLGSLVDRSFSDMKAGDTLHVTVGRLSTDEGDRAILEMSDDGRPIDEGYLQVVDASGDWADGENAIVDVTALGLALARRLVAMHGGELSIDRLESGTYVRIMLPIGIDVAQSLTLASGDGNAATTPGDSGDPAAEKETTVLVVDDHPGTRGYLAYALRKHHNVIEAANGQEALALIKEKNPDLVVSDIMMPLMDGTALCRAIKTDEHLNHIPIFLVTANAGSSIKREGLESGADDYLTKPFDLEEAVMRINNEINTRRQLRQRFTREVVIKPSDIIVTSADEAFLNRARQIAEENMKDGNFGVQELASELNLSPRQLQRRLRETVELPPVEFIRNLRLQRAAQLLEGRFGNVSEVAYSVGFTSLSYFAKCFREHYGMAPSEFKSNQAA